MNGQRPRRSDPEEQNCDQWPFVENGLTTVDTECTREPEETIGSFEPIIELYVTIAYLSISLAQEISNPAFRKPNSIPPTPEHKPPIVFLVLFN